MQTLIVRTWQISLCARWAGEGTEIAGWTLGWTKTGGAGAGAEGNKEVEVGARGAGVGAGERAGVGAGVRAGVGAGVRAGSPRSSFGRK